MKKHEDGGPASPHAHEDYPFQHGMSLRDYFAAAALTGFIIKRHSFDRDLTKYASVAYIFADAMLSARNKKGVKS